jgi:hypothetical protein
MQGGCSLYNSNFTHWIWYLAMACELVLACSLVYNKAYKRWPSLLAYVSSDLAASLVLGALRSHPPQYYYAYWSCFAVAAVLRFWLLADVLRSFPGADSVMPTQRKFLTIAGGVTLASCLGFWAFTNESIAITMKHIALTIDGTGVLVWGTFLACAVVSIVLFRLRWSKIGSLVALGLVIRTGVWLVFADLRLGGPVSLSTALQLQFLAAISAFAIWMVAMNSRDAWLGANS